MHDISSLSYQGIPLPNFTYPDTNSKYFLIWKYLHIYMYKSVRCLGGISRLDLIYVVCPAHLPLWPHVIIKLSFLRIYSK